MHSKLTYPEQPGSIMGFLSLFSFFWLSPDPTTKSQIGCFNLASNIFKHMIVRPVNRTFVLDFEILQAKLKQLNWIPVKLRFFSQISSWKPQKNLKTQEKTSLWEEDLSFTEIRFAKANWNCHHAVVRLVTNNLKG